MSFLFKRSSQRTRKRSHLTENVREKPPAPTIFKCPPTVIPTVELAKGELELEIAENFRHGSQLNFGKVFQ